MPFHVCNGGHGCGEGCPCPCHCEKPECPVCEREVDLQRTNGGWIIPTHDDFEGETCTASRTPVRA